MQRTRRWIKAVPEVSAAKTNRNARAATHHGSLRMLPLCASLVALGLSATFGPVHAQTLNLTSASPSYDVGSTTYSITGLTVANGVNGVITGEGGDARLFGRNRQLCPWWHDEWFNTNAEHVGSHEFYF